MLRVEVTLRLAVKHSSPTSRQGQVPESIHRKGWQRPRANPESGPGRDVAQPCCPCGRRGSLRLLLGSPSKNATAHESWHHGWARARPLFLLRVTARTQGRQVTQFPGGEGRAAGNNVSPGWSLSLHSAALQGGSPPPP